MVYASPLNSETSSKPLIRKDLVEEGIENSMNLMHVARPGNRFKVRVKKVLENGLLVSFFKFFYGFIFVD